MSISFPTYLPTLTLVIGCMLFIYITSQFKRGAAAYQYLLSREQTRKCGKRSKQRFPPTRDSSMFLGTLAIQQALHYLEFSFKRLASWPRCQPASQLVAEETTMADGAHWVKRMHVSRWRKQLRLHGPSKFPIPGDDDDVCSDRESGDGW